MPPPGQHGSSQPQQPPGHPSEPHKQPEAVPLRNNPHEMAGPYARQQLKRGIDSSPKEVTEDAPKELEHPQKKSDFFKEASEISSKEETKFSNEMTQEASEGIDGSVKQRSVTSGTPEIVTLEEQKQGFEKFKADFDVVLKELGVSRRTFIASCIGCGVLIALIVLLVVFWGAIFGDDPRGVPTPPPEESPIVAIEEIPAITAESTLPLYWIEPSLYSSILLGKTVSLPAITPLFSLGEPSVFTPNLLVYAIDDLRRTTNFLAVDVLEMLKQSVYRTHALDAHIVLGKSLQKTLEDRKAMLSTEYDSLQESLQAFSAKKNESEQQFFGSAKQLLPEQTDAALSSFIENGREAFEFHARARAVSKVFDFYAIALPRLQKRIHDMEVNRDALLSGVQVTDVQGSDLRLILEDERLE